MNVICQSGEEIHVIVSMTCLSGQHKEIPRALYKPHCGLAFVTREYSSLLSLWQNNVDILVTHCTKALYDGMIRVTFV